MIDREELCPRVLVGADMGEELFELYREGLKPGASTGWRGVDPHYTVGRGQWTLITGIPGHGKTEWLDALMVNLAEAEKWQFAIYSPENYPQALHAQKLIEKRLRKPFGLGPTERMSEDEMLDGVQWLGMRYGFIGQSQEQANSVDDILDECWAWLKLNASEYTHRGIVIDPWNELEHQRPQGTNETEYVSETLSKIRRFARLMDCHIWLVAHPAKLFRDKNGKRPIPTPYDVSGSAHFFNKADNCITIWRDVEEGGQMVEIHVQKIRFKHIGKPGMIELRYDRVTGRYSDMLRVVGDDPRSRASGVDI